MKHLPLLALLFLFENHDETLIPANGITPLKTVWTHKTVERTQILTAFEDNLFTYHSDGTLTAINIFDNRISWTLELNSLPLCSQVINRNLIVITSEGIIYYVHPEEGRILDSHNSGINPIVTAVISEDEHLFVSTAKETLRLSIKDAAPLWSAKVNADQILISKQVVIKYGNSIILIDKADGSEISRAEFNNILDISTNDDSIAVIQNNKTDIFNSSNLSKISTIDMQDNIQSGKIILTRKSKLIAVTIADENNYFNPVIQQFSYDPKQKSFIRDLDLISPKKFYFDLPILLQPICFLNEKSIISIGNSVYVADLTGGAFQGDVIDFQYGAIKSVLYHNNFVFIQSGNSIICSRTGNDSPSTITYSFFERKSSDSFKITWAGAADKESSELGYYIQYSIGNLEDFTAKADPLFVGINSKEHSISTTAKNSKFLRWRVRVQDKNGAFSRWSKIYTYSILIDSTPPNTPRFLNVLPQNNSVIVEYSPSESEDVYYFNLYMKEKSKSWANSTVVTEIPVRQIKINNLDNLKPYEFGVTAVDFNLNESSPMIVSEGKAAPNVLLNGKYSFSSIQSAINNADSGDIIELNKNIFSENIYINKPLTIIGATPKDSVLTSNANSSTIVTVNLDNDGEVKIKNLHITSSADLSGINVMNGKVLIENVIIDNIRKEAVVASQTCELIVKNTNIVWNNIGIKSYSDLLLVKNSIICYNNLAFDCIDSFNYSYNTISNNVRNFSTDQNLKETSSSKTPIFLIPIDTNHYLIDPISPTIDAGDPSDPVGNEIQPNGNRINIGAYGGTIYASSRSFVPFSGSDISTLDLKSISLASTTDFSTGTRLLKCYIFTPILPISRLNSLNHAKLVISTISTLPAVSLKCYEAVSPKLSQFLIKKSISRQISWLDTTLLSWFLMLLIPIFVAGALIIRFKRY
ncbi:MAG: hypothetical protein HY606_04820 [Planctomycetes bacterium]|nr:hypothetical protein [Planctomycetota bacterium]